MFHEVAINKQITKQINKSVQLIFLSGEIYECISQTASAAIKIFDFISFYLCFSFHSEIKIKMIIQFFI